MAVFTLPSYPLVFKLIRDRFAWPKAMSRQQIEELAQEIRDFLVREVSRTGGHLGPNLGVVELTIALHRVFDSPADAIVFDTGHQSYVHKILTGRTDFSTLRQRDGLAGYPSRAESEHDHVENSHASTSLSWAEGIATGRRLRGERAHTVAVIGDGALTGGMAWEALNNIAADKDLPLVIVVNDNERSYAPTIGGLADHLAMLRTSRQYEQVLAFGKEALPKAPLVGRTAYQAFHSLKKGAKDFWAPQGMFEDLGIKYLGPVDGHDEGALEQALRRAKAYGGPVLVHCITQKGRGYDKAVDDIADQFHAVGKINPETGLPLEIAGRSWTDEFSDELLRIGHERRDVVAITAAMMMPVGLQPFADAFPDRIFDVGIAEQHGATMAAGLAHAGLHPVVAIYATFLNRAFDQLLMDVGLIGQPVTLVLDRAGVTGSDGASHNGVWDMAIASIVPGIRIAAPRDTARLREEFAEAITVDDGPTVVRFPKGAAGPDIDAVERLEGGVDVLARPGEEESDDFNVLIVAVGAFSQYALDVAAAVRADGIRATVVDPRWVIPVSPSVIDEAAQADLVVVYEDGVVRGGVGSAVTEAVAAAELDVPVRHLAFPDVFPLHASRGEILEQYGLDPVSAAAQVREWARSLAD